MFAFLSKVGSKVLTIFFNPGVNSFSVWNLFARSQWVLLFHVMWLLLPLGLLRSSGPAAPQFCTPPTCSTLLSVLLFIKPSIMLFLQPCILLHYFPRYFLANPLRLFCCIYIFPGLGSENYVLLLHTSGFSHLFASSTASSSLWSTYMYIW